MSQSGFSKKNPYLAVGLTIFPGLGQIYIGKSKKGISLLIITLGVLLTIIFTHSYIIYALAIMIYFVTMVPAAIEAYQIAKFGRNTLDLDSRWYVVLLLLTTGFSALPLLWQSPNFTRNGKVAWSIAVPTLAIIFFSCLAWLGPEIDIYLENYFGELP
jgi:TM2 domain-containing membrane protein YozV